MYSSLVSLTWQLQTAKTVHHVHHQSVTTTDSCCWFDASTQFCYSLAVMNVNIVYNATLISSFKKCFFQFCKNILISILVYFINKYEFLNLYILLILNY